MLFHNLETEFSRMFFLNLLNKVFRRTLNPFVQNVKLPHLLICLQKQLIDVWNMKIYWLGAHKHLLCNW